MQAVEDRETNDSSQLSIDQLEVLDSNELAKRLNVPATWVRSRTNLKRTNDPIPHLRFGRYVRFSWGSETLREWLDRQSVSTNGQVIRRR